MVYRKWCIEFEGAHYHILSRGNERKNIFTDNYVRISFLDILGKTVELPHKGSLLKYLSWMMGNYHVQFLGGNRAAMLVAYPVVKGGNLWEPREKSP